MKRILLVISALPLVACGSTLPLHQAALDCANLSKFQRYDCYKTVALEQKNSAICDYIIDPGFRVTCKKDLAKQECDPSICNTIDGEWKRPACREDVQTQIDRDKCGEPVEKKPFKQQ